MTPAELRQCIAYQERVLREAGEREDVPAASEALVKLDFLRRELRALCRRTKLRLAT